MCPNHVISTDDAVIQARCPKPQPELARRTTLAMKAEPLPVECVARGYISGSLFKEYGKQGGGVHDLRLPAGLVESERLAEPIFTPATKAQTGHDENISFRAMVDVVGREVAEQARDWTLELYRRASLRCAEVGIILADTKFEFGLTADGLILIDEALTPDSSRFWDASLYTPGQGQPSYDKQFVRDYLETSGWSKTPPGPALPEDVVTRTRAKYLEAYERVTGQHWIS
jgi:phosphoribosylaminoimidazole-succinocarboxamide synthase